MEVCIIKQKTNLIMFPAYLHYIHPMLQPTPSQVPSIRASAGMVSSSKSLSH